MTSNTTTTNFKPLGLASYLYEPVDIKNNNKVDNLLEISANSAERPKCTKNLSLKTHEILEGKVVVLAKELD